MTHDHDTFLDLCAGEALGSLDAAERARLAELVASSPARREELAAYRELASTLAEGLEPSAPSSHVKAAVLAAIADGGEASTPERAAEASREPGRLRLVRTWQWAAAACLLLALGLGALWMGARSDARRDLRDAEVRHSQERERLVADLETARAANTTLRDEYETAMQLLGSAQARVATLEATANGSAATAGRIVVDPRTGRTVVVLPQLDAPTDRDYQLWSIRAEEGQDPVIRSLGLVTRSATGATILVLDTMAGGELPQEIAMSLERKGGASTSSAPEGPVVAAAVLP